MDSHIVKLISNIPTLSAETWEVWSWEVESALNLGGQWDTVLAKDPTSKQRPVRPLPQKADAPTVGELEKQTAYDTANRQAAGLIRHAAGIAHREITQAANATAATMFDALEALYAKKSGGARFDAWTVLLAIQKLETETFPNLVKRIDAAAFRLDSLRPAGWTLAKEINEIKTFVMLNAIPQTHLLYGSLIAQPDTLTYDNVKAVFLMYKSPATGISEAASFAGARPTCLFCKNSGHTVEVCNNMRYYQRIYLEERAKRAAQGNTSRGNRGHGNRGGQGGYSNSPRHQANAAQVIEAFPEPSLTAEYTGNASLLSPDSPASADTHWVADTGASCHMTSHREWLTGFSESEVIVELADGSVIYGTGRGTISFIPYINGYATRPIVLQNVLYVPSLRNNLFSIFHFTVSTQATAEVSGAQMAFHRNGTIILTAT